MIEIPECLTGCRLIECSTGTMGTILHLVLSACSEVCSFCGCCIGFPAGIPEIGMIFMIPCGVPGCCCSTCGESLNLIGDLIFELCPPVLGLF